MSTLVAKSHRHSLSNWMGRTPFEHKVERKAELKKWVKGATRKVERQGASWSLDYMLCLCAVLIVIFAGVINYTGKTKQSTLPMSMGH